MESVDVVPRIKGSSALRVSRMTHIRGLTRRLRDTCTLGIEYPSGRMGRVGYMAEKCKGIIEGIELPIPEKALVCGR